MSYYALNNFLMGNFGAFETVELERDHYWWGKYSQSIVKTVQFQ